MNGVLLKKSGRVEDFQDAGYGRSMSLDGVNLFALIEQMYQICRQLNIRERYFVTIPLAVAQDENDFH